MQKLLKRPRISTDPSGLANSVPQPNQPSKGYFVGALAKLQRRILGQESYNQLVESVQQRVRKQYGTQLAAAQKDIFHVIDAVLEGVAKEWDEINQRFLLQLEDLEEARCSKEKACYEAAVARVLAACIVPNLQPASLGLEPPRPTNTVSSMMTQYSNPFGAFYGPPMMPGYAYTDYEATRPPPVASPIHDVQDVESQREEDSNLMDVAGESRKATLRPNAQVTLAGVYGVRLVPKASPKSPTAAYYGRFNALSIYSQPSNCFYVASEAQWPGRLTSQSNPGPPSTGFVVPPAQYIYSERHLSVRTISSSECVLTPVVQEPQSLRFSCDEFGRF